MRMKDEPLKRSERRRGSLHSSPPRQLQLLGPSTKPLIGICYYLLQSMNKPLEACPDSEDHEFNVEIRSTLR